MSIHTWTETHHNMATTNRLELQPCTKQLEPVAFEAAVDHSRDIIVRMPEVRRRTGISAATIYRKMASGDFPRQVRLSVNVVGWYESDINHWISNPMGWQRLHSSAPLYPL